MLEAESKLTPEFSGFFLGDWSLGSTDEGLPSSAFSSYCLHTRMSHQEQWQAPCKPDWSASISKTDSLCGHAKGGHFFLFCFSRCICNNSHFKASFLRSQVTIFPELPWWFGFIVLHCISEPLPAKQFPTCAAWQWSGNGLNEDCQELGSVTPEVSSAICNGDIH